MHPLSQNVLRSALDPMCYPQLVDPLRLPNQTYAQSLIAYINFVIEDPQTDTDDPLVIY